jgi:hypothetical protein
MHLSNLVFKAFTPYSKKGFGYPVRGRVSRLARRAKRAHLW